ncbi:MAG: hypothetical protein ACKO4T_03400 [Planctomycetaceae bacterium]
MPLLPMPMVSPLLVDFPPLGPLSTVGREAATVSRAALAVVHGGVRGVPVAAGDADDDDEELGDEEDLAVSQPPVEEDSTFDDFDDEFDDDFEEEENDPDWDHPDEGDEPPPEKPGGRKK